MENAPHIICFGAAHWDVIARARPGARGAAPRGPDAPGVVTVRPGGVALNVACALAAAGFAVSLVSAVGDDDDGDALLARIEAAGVNAGGVIRYAGAGTGRYVAIERADGELVAAVADAAALEAMTPAHLPLDRLAPAALWLTDANPSAAVIRALAMAPGRPPLAADATSEAKAVKLRPVLAELAAIYCNRAEAEAICATGLNAARAAAEALCARGAARAVVTNGVQPAADAGRRGVVTARPDPSPVRSVTGAGDALVAAHAGAALRGATPEAALAAGLAAAGAHARAA
ncbi:PfkB family carbohydrate kinase [Rubrimonas cliftonensis]|uniref:Sugar or nucleoside kinase, ribokinase family n=1 Tax=Rubrimonas cliftonensis TaxID=89524 RepID=A0A1H3X8B0_9RHOB|nr:PfkB family carbohydrate kinase [Rubrimonas cliftonensis]SDZ94882.1 Sugar or nucleoside kinase, ribokinase family [Rubrimonas cliftonensis]